MTKHRKKEEWVAEILDAAADRIVVEGYSNLTMESIAAHTTLSKGGVYRYFGNKRDVAIALFARVYNNSMNFAFDDILAWNVSIEETIQRLLVVRTPPRFVRITTFGFSWFLRRSGTTGSSSNGSSFSTRSEAGSRS